MSGGGKRVQFAHFVEVNIFEALDPNLNSDLFYSREEMQLIRKRLKSECTFNSICQGSTELKGIKDNQVYIDYLKNKPHGTTRGKRPIRVQEKARKRPLTLVHEEYEPSQGEARKLAKRRRIAQQSAK